MAKDQSSNVQVSQNDSQRRETRSRGSKKYMLKPGCAPHRGLGIGDDVPMIMPGEIVESETDLAKSFPHKFTAIDEDTPEQEPVVKSLEGSQQATRATQTAGAGK